MLILGIIAACGIYIATGGGAAERWKQATTAGGPPTAALMYGKKKEEKAKKRGEAQGFDKGYNTLNPALRVEEIINAARSPLGDATMSVGKAMVGGVAQEAAGRMLESGAQTARGWFEDPGKGGRG